MMLDDSPRVDNFLSCNKSAILRKDIKVFYIITRVLLWVLSDLVLVFDL